jgi:hypothetical protein
MQVLIAVVNDPEKVDEILSGYLELGITGATIINSEGMGRVLSHDIPIFAGPGPRTEPSSALSTTRRSNPPSPCCRRYAGI